jgi:pantoate kinase
MSDKKSCPGYVKHERFAEKLGLIKENQEQIIENQEQVSEDQEEFLARLPKTVFQCALEEEWLKPLDLTPETGFAVDLPYCLS